MDNTNTDFETFYQTVIDGLRIANFVNKEYDNEQYKEEIRGYYDGGSCSDEVVVLFIS